MLTIVRYYALHYSAIERKVKKQICNTVHPDHASAISANTNVYVHAELKRLKSKPKIADQ